MRAAHRLVRVMGPAHGLLRAMIPAHGLVRIMIPAHGLVRIMIPAHGLVRVMIPANRVVGQGHLRPAQRPSVFQIDDSLFQHALGLIVLYDFIVPSAGQSHMHHLIKYITDACNGWIIRAKPLVKCHLIFKINCNGNWVLRKLIYIANLEM